MIDNRKTGYLILVGSALFNISWTFGHRFLDSRIYLTAATFFLGADPSEFRLGASNALQLRPVVPFLTSLLSPVVELDVAFAIVSSVFWLGTCLLLFKLTQILTHSYVGGLWAGLLFNFSAPVLAFGASLLTDMTSWFSLTLGLYLLARWKGRMSLSRTVASALVVGVGVLTREIVLSLVLAHLLAVAWGRDTSRRDLLRLGVFLLFAALPVVLWNWYLGKSLLIYYQEGPQKTISSYSAPGPSAWEVTLYGSLDIDARTLPLLVLLPLRWTGSLVAAFHGALALALIRFRESIAATKALRLWPYLIATVPVFLARSFMELRLMFILFPVILPIAAVHLTGLGRKGAWVMAAYALASYALAGALWALATQSPA
ncbi:MAG: hypothetical protein ACE5IJ_12460 [Thermoplasmata archaeon]